MLLGLDLGTTNIKAVLSKFDGTIIDSGSAPVQIKHLPQLGAEQDIEDIWSATLRALESLADKHSLSDVRAIGVSSQGGALQIQHADGKPWGAVIGWMDGRSSSWDDAFTEEVGRRWLGEHLGRRKSGMTIGRVLKLTETCPDLPEDFRIGYVGDVIVSRLCGRAAHDVTSLSIAMLNNPSTATADADVLARLNLSESRLPDLLAANTSAGGLLASVAKRTGLPEGIPVSPAVHDQYCAILGCGAVNAGDIMFGAGTAWVLVAIADHLVDGTTDTAYVCPHPVEYLWGQLLSLGNGGSSISWVLKTLRLDSCTSNELDAMINSIEPGCDGLTFWPLLAPGAVALVEGTAGRFDGLRLAHTPAHMVRAAVEGLACELARYLKYLTDSKWPVQRLIMGGRAAASSVTPQIIADTTGVEITCMAESEMSAKGAAILARSLCEPSSILADLSERMSSRGNVLQPGKNRRFYAELLDSYVYSLPIKT